MFWLCGSQAGPYCVLGSIVSGLGKFVWTKRLRNRSAIYFAAVKTAWHGASV